ncbi:hypothetical protein A3762_02345 [Oleiphilus sp. HI0125]|uniref:hypothetical protein n=2 Tax=Oleiphilus sp. HI0125 TaxID=1822266 RepID=UPI0007C28EAD|nr:hypothetical protein [Oleiphilus sp. HI0125]KZZ61292.1 hypothetical protein A3762_02345 [Oleiphilus sp. HI0125]
MFKSCVLALVSVTLLALPLTISAEEKKPSIEDLVETPVQAITDLSEAQPKRAKLTEEQAIAQLQYMMLNAFKRIEPILLERGSFKPVGMTLDPDGTFRSVRVDGQEEMPQAIALDAIVSSLKSLAANRTQWAVGVMYVTGKKQEDGRIQRRIMVATEHIAGWARTWSYPYFIDGEQVKMGSPFETEMKPVYYK